MENETKPLNPMAKVVGINLAVLLGLTAVFMGIDAGTNGGGEMVFGGMLILVPLQTLACFITALVFFGKNRTPYGQAFLVATFVVAVVGFSACWGGLMAASNGSLI